MSFWIDALLVATELVIGHARNEEHHPWCLIQNAGRRSWNCLPKAQWCALLLCLGRARGRSPTPAIPPPVYRVFPRSRERMVSDAWRLGFVPQIRAPSWRSKDSVVKRRVDERQRRSHEQALRRCAAPALLGGIIRHRRADRHGGCHCVISVLAQVTLHCCHESEAAVAGSHTMILISSLEVRRCEERFLT